MKLLGPTTPEDFVGRPLADELSLSLCHAPAHGVRQDLDDGTVRYAVLLGQALGRRALMDLLYTLAPYKAHGPDRGLYMGDRKSTRLNSSHSQISYAVFCLKKKKKIT